MADADHAIIVSVSAFSSNVAKYDKVESVTAHKYVVSCCLYSSSGLPADSLMISSARNNFEFIRMISPKRGIDTNLTGFRFNSVQIHRQGHHDRRI